jgi:FMN phosphatase YigB (HAD superfamily)
MYEAILFDLDGTLLGLDNSRFVSAYFKAMAPKIAPLFGQSDFTIPILAGTEAMMRSQGHHASLRDCFIEAFDLKSPLPFHTIESVFLDFYSSDFNLVSAIAQRSELAPKVLQAAAAQTSRIVLATVPVFPLIAVEARRVWAGIESFPFTLITSFENMRYCKPSPRYYNEIAERIGVAPEQCLMIGNDHVDDLSAAATGMETYLVLDDPLNAGKGEYSPTYSGYLADVLAFLRNE